MKLAVSTHIFAPWKLVPRHFELIRDAGFSAVEIWAMAPHVEIERPGALARIGEEARKLGLDVLSVHLPFYRRYGSPSFRFLSLGDPNRRASDLARRLIDPLLVQIRDLGARIAVLHGPGVSEGDSETLRRLMSLGTSPMESITGGDPVPLRRLYDDDLAPILDATESLGLTLAIENIMTPLSSAREIADLVDRTNRPSLAACLDTGHARISEDPLEAAKTLAHRIVTTHLQDNRGTHDEHLIPGDGVIDWPQLLAALRDAADPNMVLEIRWPIGGDKSEEAPFVEHLRKAREAAERLFPAAFHV